MTKVCAHMTMSLDGFIADPNDGVDELFAWYSAGDVHMDTANEDVSFDVDATGASMLRELLDTAGAVVCGRRLFDITDGWGDSHPIGAPTVCITHQPPADTSRWPRTTFVTDLAEGIARAKQIAGDKDVCVASADIARQALDAGVLDEVAVSLVPVLLGKGIPYFANLTDAPHRFEDPIVLPGTRATHLRYRVRR